MSTRLYAFKASDENILREQIGIAKFLSNDLHMEESIEFQVFNTSIGIVYRILELGNGLKNQMWNNEIFFPRCVYDNICDIPKEDLSNEVIANEIDVLITNHDYRIIDIASKRNM